MSNFFSQYLNQKVCVYNFCSMFSSYFNRDEHVVAAPPEQPTSAETTTKAKTKPQ